MEVGGQLITHRMSEPRLDLARRQNFARMLSWVLPLRSILKECRCDQPIEQHFVDFAAKADFTADFDDGHTLIELLAKFWILVDVNPLYVEITLGQHPHRVIAQMASGPGIDSRLAG